MVTISATMPGIIGLNTLKDAFVQQAARTIRFDMKYVHKLFQVGSFLMLEILWNIQRVVDKYFSCDNSILPSIPPTTPSAAVPPDLPVVSKELKYKKRRKRGLFFDPRSGRRRSYLSMADLILPAEEKMLMLLCAKGYSDSTESLADTDFLRTVEQIPRSKFTAIWIEACGK